MRLSSVGDCDGTPTFKTWFLNLYPTSPYPLSGSQVAYMPALEGFKAWIETGEHVVPEYGADALDDETGITRWIPCKVGEVRASQTILNHSFDAITERRTLRYV